MLNDCVTRLVSERSKLELSEIILMQVSLLQFASQCYPGRLEYVNHCIGERERVAGERWNEGGRDGRGLSLIAAVVFAPVSPFSSAFLSVLYRTMAACLSSFIMRISFGTFDTMFSMYTCMCPSFCCPWPLRQYRPLGQNQQPAQKRGDHTSLIFASHMSRPA